MSAPTVAPAAPASVSPAGAPRPIGPAISSDATRTLRVLLASGLAVVPLLQMVSDLQWLVDAWIGMAIILLPAAALRLRWPATTVQLLPGFILLLPYLTRRYVSEHAWGGFIPTRASWDDVRALSRDLGHTVANSVAPIQSTVAARLFLTAGLAVLALLIDLIAIELRRPALTGVPFLVLFAVAGAIPRHAVNWAWFAIGAIGYLLVLSMDAQDALPTWGRFIERRGGRSSISNAFSGRRIGVAAVVIAILVPLIIPSRSHDLLADALHNGRAGTGGDGNGSGGIPPGSSRCPEGSTDQEQAGDVVHRHRQERVIVGGALLFALDSPGSVHRFGLDTRRRRLDSTALEGATRPHRTQPGRIRRHDHDRQVGRRRTRVRRPEEH